MKKTALVLAGALGSAAALSSIGALAQSPLQCVNPDIVNAFLLTSRDGPGFEFSDEPPAALARHEAPPQFVWIGSRSADFDTRAAYRTQLPAHEAQRAFLDSLHDAGFRVQERTAENGFQLSRPPLSSAFCNDDGWGLLTVRDSGSARYLTLTLPAERRDCSVLEPPQLPAMARGSTYLPLIELPPEVLASTRLAGLPTGNRGSGETWRTALEVEGVRSIQALAAQLAGQIAAQGWQPETNWAGTLSAGSTWTREADGAQMAGRLSVEDIRGGYTHLEFKLVTLN